VSVDEKLQAMEAIWASLAKNPDDVPSPAWHGEVLRERQREVDAGEAKFLAWDAAQREIDRLVAQGTGANSPK
jgi:hypothetical protein